MNNAGITASHPIEAFPEDAWARIVAVHLTGTFACARAAFATMRTAGRRGRILNTTSGAGLDHVYPGTAAYAAAKGGVVSLTRVIAAEGAPHGITCNAIAPLARTRMSTAFLGAEEEEPTALDPAALGPLVVYLASEASAGVSGAVFTFRRGRIGIGRLDVREEIAPRDAGWTLDELHARLPMLLGPAG